MRIEDESEDENRIQYTLDYIHNFDGNGKKLSINFQYSSELEDILNNITETDTQLNLLNDLEQVIENQDENRGLLQIDYIHPVGEKIQYEAGYRGNYRNIYNQFFLAERQDFPDGPLIPDAGLNNAFDYRELINAMYFQYGQEFGKVSLLLGLRFEYTAIEIEQETLDSSDKKSYENLFPTFNFGYKFKDDQSFNIAYNRRFRRPRGWFLNPFPSRSSESNIFSGNIDLNPVTSDASEISYLRRWDKITLGTSVYYNTSANNWEFIQQSTGELTDNGDPIVRRFPINLSTQKRLGYEFTVSYRPMKAWTINSDFNLFKVTTEGDYTDPETLVTQNFDFENTSFNIRMNQKISFPNKIDLQINSNYRGPSKNVQSAREGIFSMNIAMSKDLFKERASLNLNVNDVFNSRKRK